ncbi:BTAD domain-containing putative transcriptional regulator [Streptomyces sp. WMMC500]|uniref:AfsR/SARP family transcriptional regulator n=1 Tax=Streptomyces sp. WMMC500 TaxID=3015154 RepID=UPI00248C0490|nr:BTAD domain-containing putative transcriptional regulator [Streptomyces sp. WMMC500]WBB61636.1 BTAD domain-containing putative transcriptional regulator [Streptomyces sp. WMMC500]
MLSVELLGPLRVAVAGRPVELPAGRLRALLAVLAMSAGRTVSTAHLADAVWGADMCGDPRTNVRTNVMRLRRALGRPGDTLVAARPGGYVLLAGPEQVDALRFTRLLDAAAANGTAERDRLAAALTLWRGTPFDGIRSDRLEGTEAPALEERYLAAVERCVDLDLAPGADPRRAGRTGTHGGGGADGANAPHAPGEPAEPLEPAESAEPAEPAGPVGVAALAALAERHPLRESLWARLLRVLDAAGRPAEALERYETIRRRLAAELGVDPSPELRRVHAGLLAAEAPRDEGRPVPRHLPAATSAFAARDAERAALDALLELPPPPTAPDAGRDARVAVPPGGAGTLASPPHAPVIALVSGTAGVGKTTLAVHWAHRVADRFPDGQLYVDLRGYDPSGEAVQPAAAVREFLGALGVPPHRVPEGPAAQAGLYRTLLAGRRVLVLLDNARDAAQVAPLLPAAPGCLALVTARDHLAGLVVTHGARPLVLDVLPPGAARELLAARLGRNRLAAEPAAVDEIVRRCAGLPLALAVVAARAALHPALPLAALAGELRDTLGALERTADVRALFSWSYETLSDPAARLFRLVAGLHPGPDCGTDAAAALAGVPAARARARLAELASAGLLTERAPGRYACHDLLRAYAGELGEARDPAADRDGARRRLVDHYVRTAEAAARHLPGTPEPAGTERAGLVAAGPAPAGHAPTAAAVPRHQKARPGTPRPSTTRPGTAVAGTAGPEPTAPRAAGSPAHEPATRAPGFAGPDDAVAWLGVERSALLDVLGLAGRLRLDRDVCRLARALFVFLHWHGRWHDRADAQAAAVAAARRLGDAAEESRARRDLGSALADLGRYEDAHAHLDAALERAGDDLAGQAWTHYRRGIVHVVEDRGTEALDATRRAHDLFERLGDPAGQAIALTDLGWHHGRGGDHDRALDLLPRALVLHRKLGNRPYEAHTWSCLADVRLRRGEPAEAVACYVEALDAFRDVGDVYGEAGTLAHLGVAHRLTGDPGAADAHWRRAHALLADLDPSAVRQIHGQLSAFDAPAADAFRRAPAPRPS